MSRDAVTRGKGTPTDKKYYFIQSNLSNLVLDVDMSSTSSGTPILIYRKHGRANQQWRDDTETGTIRSKLDDNLCIDNVDNRLVLNPYVKDKKSQQWERKGNVIASRSDGGKVLDVAVITNAQGGGPNQSWTFEDAA